MLLFAVTVLISCSKKNDPEASSQEDDAEKHMTSSLSWKVQTVTIDGVDNTSQYSGFTISFTSSSYTTTNGGVVWPASGSWSFNSTGTPPVTIIRNDGKVVQIAATESTVVMTLDWPTTTLGGKMESVKGKYVFTMVKK